MDYACPMCGSVARGAAPEVCPACGFAPAPPPDAPKGAPSGQRGAVPGPERMVGPAPGPQGWQGLPWPMPVVVQRPTSGMAIASMVLGILCIFTYGFLGILALIFGVLGLRDARLGKQGKGMAIAGITLGAIGMAILAFIVLLFAGLFFEGSFDEDERTYPGATCDDGLVRVAMDGWRIAPAGPGPSGEQLVVRVVMENLDDERMVVPESLTIVTADGTLSLMPRDLGRFPAGDSWTQEFGMDAPSDVTAAWHRFDVEYSLEGGVDGVAMWYDYVSCDVTGEGWPGEATE